VKQASYREYDYSFGQAMLTLRTAIGLTQLGLAEYLGVSRQATGDWEGGRSYPKFEHLKKLLTLGVQCGAFTAGHESEEIRAFWQASHQKVRLDEAWLTELVSPESFQFSGHSDKNSDQTRSMEILERNYQRLVESISEGITVVTLEGIITSLSPALESLLGWSSEDLAGTEMRSVIHPADLPQVLERFQRYRNGELQPPMKIRLLQSSGNYVPVEVSSQPEIVNGKVGNIWVLIKDLTKDEQMQKQRAALIQEKQRVQVLTNLILTATAKVRPSLESVGLITGTLSRQNTDLASLSSLEAIGQLVQNLTATTDRILTMAELDADRSQFSFGPVDLNRLVNYVQINERSLAELQKVTLITRFSQSVVLVRADQTYLYRALQEVLENALKYTPANGTVTLDTSADDACGFVTVQDSGPGIDSELMPHLFEKFYHFGFPPAVSGALGLGLCITKKIIDEHQGTIRIESEPNRGTTCTISIPLY
jgi:PAS domain S-box-containing protein